MNFVFISPHFPHTYWNFCQRLKQNGVTVLGIADAPYEGLPHDLKESLTEYYRKLGFREIPLEGNAYERCDILMEIKL